VSEVGASRATLDRMGLDLSAAERRVMRDGGLVLFGDRLIRNARPPIDEKTLAEIAARCSGPLPEGLVALWRVTFGGTLDYDLDADFGGVIASISFRELFFPGSNHYRDLFGWIDHEAELAEDAAREKRKRWSGKLDALPFGGFEYCSRMYVRVAPGPKHGEAVAWEEGLPPAWRLRLNRDAIATIGPDVNALFQALAFDDDPRAPRGKYPSGVQLVECIEGLGDAGLRAKLLEHVGSTVLDWRAALSSGTIARDARLVRLAFLEVAKTDDLASLERLHASGCDLRAQVTGGGSVIDLALMSDSKACVRWLLERGVPVVDSLGNAVDHASVELVTELLRRGAKATSTAAVTAAANGHLDAALLILAALDAAGRKEVVERAQRQATNSDESAVSVEQKKLISDVTSAQYRDRARQLRELSKAAARKRSS